MVDVSLSAADFLVAPLAEVESRDSRECPIPRQRGQAGRSGVGTAAQVGVPCDASVCEITLRLQMLPGNPGVSAQTGWASAGADSIEWWRVDHYRPRGRFCQA